MRRPLEGIRVVALEQAVAMPYGSFVLAELGADVVKIERPGTGDVVRGWDEAVRGLSTGYVWVNANKRDVAIDLADEAGRDIVRRLARQTDVFLENLAPGAAGRLGLADTDLRVRENRGVSPAFLFATLLWHEVLATWNAAKAAGGRPMPALFVAMDDVLSKQAKKIAVPRRFEATIKEIWALQPRFEQRSGQRPYRLIEHPRFRAGWDFLDLRCRSGELEGERAQLAEWWDRFAHATPEAREAMLKPDTEPKKRTRARSRGRRRRADGEAVTPAPSSDAPQE